MAAIANEAIFEEQCEVKVEALLDIAINKRPRPLLPDTARAIKVRAFHQGLLNMVGHQGEKTRASILLSSLETSKSPFFHGACVYLPDRQELYSTSSFIDSTTPGNPPVIIISKVQIYRNQETKRISAVIWQKLRPPPNMPMPAGAISYNSGVLFCSQGSAESGTGGLYHMPYGKPPVPLLTNFHGRDFNSIRSVVQGKDGLWFTDPISKSPFLPRSEPELPPHMYLLNRKVGFVRVMADCLRHPQAIALSYDEKTLFVSDIGTSESIPPRPGAVYAFDIIERHGEPFLTNSRVFGYPLRGEAKHILCGHKVIYIAAERGVEVWNEGGTLLGCIEVPGGASNLCFGRHGHGKSGHEEQELFICSDQRLWSFRHAQITDPAYFRTLKDTGSPVSDV